MLDIQLGCQCRVGRAWAATLFVLATAGSDMVSATDIWPVFRGDARHSGVTERDAPYDSMLAWSYATGDSVLYASPAVAADGTVYIGNLDKELVALAAVGMPRWVFVGEGNFRYSSPAIGQDGTIYVGGSDGVLYAVRPDGTRKWTFTAGGPIKTSPNIGPGEIIYFGADDGCLYAVRSDSTLAWSYTTGGIVRSSPAIGPDGTIFFGSADHYLYALWPNGTLRWRAATGGEIKYCSPAVSSDNVVYFGSYDGYLYAVTINQQLVYATYTGHVIRSSPALTPDGRVFIGSGNWLLAVKADGTIDWEYGTEGEVTSSPLYSTDDEVVCVGAQDGVFYCVHDDGVLDWTYTVGEPLRSSPAPGYGNMVHVADVTGVLWSFGIGPSVDVGEREIAGGTRGLMAYPNPSTGRVALRLADDLRAEERIVVLDAAGRCVAVLSGRGRDVRWDGRDRGGVQVAAGSYLFQRVATGCSGRVLILR